MSANLRHWRPNSQTIAALIGLVIAFFSAAIRDFIWADLRDGMIDVRGLKRTTRTLVILGFGLLLIMIGLLLASDLLRSQFPLLPMIVTLPGRGWLFPLPVLPLTLFMITFAWSFVLAGALHSHFAIRLGILLLYLIHSILQVAFSNASIQLVTIDLSNSADMLITLAPIGVALAGIVAVPLFFIIRWRAQQKPVLEFALLLLFVTLPHAAMQASNVNALRAQGVSLDLPMLAATLGALQLLTFPFLIFIGMNIAHFTQQAAKWTTSIVTEGLPTWSPYLLLPLLAAWQLLSVGLEAAEEFNMLAYAGALGEIALVGLAWWLLKRLLRFRTARTEEADEVALVEQAAEIRLSSEEVVESAQSVARPLIVFQFIWFAIIFFVFQFNLSFLSNLVVPGVALSVALWFAYRGKYAVPLYLIILSFLRFWGEMTKPGQVLGVLARDGKVEVDFWWVVLIALASLIALLQDQLTEERARQLFFILLVITLLRQTDFIEDPFSPLAEGIGFTGIGFIAFGLIWDALTAGAWANQESPRLSRVSRIFLYLGYALLTVTLVNWTLTSHHLELLGLLTGEAAALGLSSFGRPMIYAIFALILMSPPAAEEPVAGAGRQTYRSRS